MFLGEGGVCDLVMVGALLRASGTDSSAFWNLTWRWMDGWMDGGWVDGWMDGWMNQCVYGGMNGWVC